MPADPHTPVPAPGAAVPDAARLRVEIDDVFLPDAGRLDDRTRVTVRALLRGAVATIEDDIRRRAARLLVATDADAAAESLLDGAGAGYARLLEAGVLRDPALMAEIIAEARLTQVAERLPRFAAADRPELLLRLAAGGDATVAAAARALLAADARDAQPLPAMLHHRLAWLVAAAVRPAAASAAVDHALAEAARHRVEAYRDDDRADMLAARLVAALDPTTEEQPALLADAVEDRRPTLFVALLAHALGVDSDAARAMLLDPAGKSLGLSLHALGMARAAIARVALALADADPRRDIDAFADDLDALVAMPAEAAVTLIAPLMLPRAYRDAVALVGGGP